MKVGVNIIKLYVVSGKIPVVVIDLNMQNTYRNETILISQASKGGRIYIIQVR